MATFLVGLALFLGTHSLSIVAPAARDRMAARLGEWPWKGLYSVASIAAFAVMLAGYGEARLEPVVLYLPPVWMKHVTLALMIPVFPLLLSAYLPGRIKTAAKHPFLAGTKLWAFAHLLANGTLHDVLLFGGFLAWAVFDRISMKKRAPRPIPGASPSPMNDGLAVVLGLSLYVLFLMVLHVRITGRSPLG